MTRQIRKHLRDFIAILVLVVLAGVVAVYVLTHERLRIPFFQTAPTKYYADFSTAQAVTPGQGQTVRVSGIQVGQIGGVELTNGVARVEMDIDHKYRDIIHTDASALLRPRTGLKDMTIELNPGSRAAPRAKPGFVIPVSRTEPDVNLDEILAALDGDTRDYLQLLVNGAGRGLAGRGGDLAEVYRRFEPTHRDLARFAGALAARRHDLRRLVTSLGTLNAALAARRTDLGELVDSSNAVFGALAAENANIARAVRDLPGALRQTTTTLGKVQTLSNILGPTATRLLPAVRQIPATNAAVSELARTTLHPVRDQIRPFVIAARPVVRDLRPAAQQLASATPHLTSTFVVLNHLFNTLAYNPKGREGPNVADRQEGFLFWLAWLDHQARSLFSGQDANGGWRPLFLTATCSNFRQLVKAQTALAITVLNLDPILNNPATCPGGASGPLGVGGTLLGVAGK